MRREMVLHGVVVHGNFLDWIRAIQLGVSTLESIPRIPDSGVRLRLPLAVNVEEPISISFLEKRLELRAGGLVCFSYKLLELPQLFTEFITRLCKNVFFVVVSCRIATDTNVPL